MHYAIFVDMCVDIIGRLGLNSNYAFPEGKEPDNYKS